MEIKRNADVQNVSLPGLEHRSLAGLVDGVQGLEIWMQTLEPGAETPMHRHDCEEVIVVLSGRGRCLAPDGTEREVLPDSTIIVRPNEPHQLINTGAEPMFLVAALGAGPVTVETAEGDRIPLPWDQHNAA